MKICFLSTNFTRNRSIAFTMFFRSCSEWSSNRSGEIQDSPCGCRADRLQHIHESESHEYVEVDRLDSDMVSFGDFANRFESYSEHDRKNMVKAMDRFLVKSADKTSIMDLHQGNLVYLPHKKQWIISDVSYGVEDLDRSKRITLRTKTVLNELTENLTIQKGS